MEIANSPTPCILLISLYNVEVKLWHYQFEFLFSNLNKLGFDTCTEKVCARKEITVPWLCGN